MAKQKFPNDKPLDGDALEMKLAINKLNELQIEFKRTSPHQLKVGLWNFYPNRGTILRDGGNAAEHNRGLPALLQLLKAAQSSTRPRKTPLTLVPIPRD